MNCRFFEEEKGENKDDIQVTRDLCLSNGIL